MSSNSFSLRENDVIKRSELHDQYGGNRQSGIAASAKTPNIFLFTHPEKGEDHGYYERWDEKGTTLFYCGEGQRGDQRMINGNKALLEHKQTGKAIRVFANDTLNAHVRYIGEFTLDEHQPYIVKKAHATNNGPERNVFEFCLHKKSK